jgi:hypothetical protein
MRVLDTVENHVHSPAGNGFLERRETLRRSESHDTLVRRGARDGAIQHFARLEAHRNATLARQLDNLLDARSSRPFGDQDTIKRAPGP